MMILLHSGIKFASQQSMHIEKYQANFNVCNINLNEPLEIPPELVIHSPAEPCPVTIAMYRICVKVKSIYVDYYYFYANRNYAEKTFAKSNGIRYEFHGTMPTKFHSPHFFSSLFELAFI